MPTKQPKDWKDQPRACALRRLPRVRIETHDAAELFFMLRGRGASSLKTKLLRALRHIDPKAADELEELERR